MPDTVKMQCLQVWGGNQAAAQTLRLTGLDGFLVSRPFEDEEAGGDVYYASSCASGRITRVVLADVAGHGQVVARFANDLRQLMQRFVNYTSHRRFIAALNDAFGKQTDSGRFATAVALSYFAPKNELHLINAGHPPPLFYCAKTKQWSILENDADDAASDSPAPASRTADLPLGIQDGVGYRSTRRQLAAGDMLLLYTDAFIEAKRPDGRLLGVEGLLESLRFVTGDTLAPASDQLLPTLIAHLAAGRANTPTLAGDDTTALLLRATGEKRQWSQVLTSPIHLVRGLALGAMPTLTH
ncbi:MAG: PP2C family protein-serine/threonine phosphatase [Phycisphaerales bacterium JB063]